MDRTESFNTVTGPLGADVRCALYDAGIHAKFVNYVYGLAGRDVTVASLTSVYEDMMKIAADGTSRTDISLSVPEGIRRNRNGI